MIAPETLNDQRYDDDYDYPHTIKHARRQWCVHKSSTGVTYLQLKLPSDMLASV